MRRIVKTRLVLVGVFVIVVRGMAVFVLVVVTVLVLVRMIRDIGVLMGFGLMTVPMVVFVTVGMSVLVIRGMRLMAVLAVFVVVLLLASVLVFAFVRHFLSPGFLILSYYFSQMEKFYNVSVGCLAKTNL